MDGNLVGRILAVFVVSLVIFGLQILSNRFFPELKKKQYRGLYLILLPLGFGLFGWAWRESGLKVGVYKSVTCVLIFKSGAPRGVPFLRLCRVWLDS